jgi:hypothetical protein
LVPACSEPERAAAQMQLWLSGAAPVVVVFCRLAERDALVSRHV